MKKRLSKSEFKRQAKKLRIKKQQKHLSFDISNQTDLFDDVKKYLGNIFSLPAQILSIFFILFLSLSVFNLVSQPENENPVEIATHLKPEIINYALADVEVPEERLNKNNIKLQNDIAKIVKNTPMEAMIDDIVQKDKPVAAFLVGIAMKESKFGIYSPKKDGTDCYNYWGYRGKENPTKSGYSCFDSPKQAVDIVGKRIENIIAQGAKTPADMVIWKCGYSCAAFSEESVNKWIADVGINYYKLNPKDEIARKEKIR